MAARFSPGGQNMAARFSPGGQNMAASWGLLPCFSLCIVSAQKIS